MGHIFLLSLPGERTREEAESTKSAEQSLRCIMLQAGDLFQTLLLYLQNEVI